MGKLKEYALTHPNQPLPDEEEKEYSTTVEDYDVWKEDQIMREYENE